MLKKTERFGSVVEAAVLQTAAYKDAIHKAAAYQQKTVDVPKDVQLQENRDHQGLASSPEGTMEARLGDARTGGEKEPYEMLMEEHRKESEAPNGRLAGITEARLNRADRKPYPHRNPEAWSRTGEKRPVNSLPEELGEASDDAKRKRYEKEIQAQGTTKRVVDKDQGSQLPFKPFNSRHQKSASLAPYGGYLAYRAAAESGDKGAFAEVASLDEAIGKVVSASVKEDRPLKDDEKAAIGAMKERKFSVLRGSDVQ